MKKTIGLLMMIVFIANTSFGQKEKTAEQLEKIQLEKEVFLKKQNTFSISPFNILGGQAQISYERKFGNRNSLMFLGSFIHNSDLNNTLSNVSLGFSTEIHYRRYLANNYLTTKKKPVSQNSYGFYIAPFTGYQYLEIDNAYYYYNINPTSSYVPDHKSHSNSVQVGLLTGINFNLLKGKMSLDFYAGFAEKISFNKTSNITYHNSPGDHQFGVTGIIPKANMQIGFNF